MTLLSRFATTRPSMALMSAIGLAAMLMFSACATHERVVVRETVVAQPVIRHMPPPIREERGAPPTVGWNWVPGHWKWEGHEWAWVHGKWVPEVVAPMPPIVVETVAPPPSPAHYWVPGHWVWRHDATGWVWVQGRWLR